MRSSSRAAFAWALAAYAVSAVALHFVLDNYRPHAALALHRMKWEQLVRRVQAEPERPLVVMLGSSRVDMAFQAARLDGQPGPDGRPLLAYNFGIPADGPMHARLRLQDMLRAGIRPRLLLVEFLPPLLTEPHSHLLSEEGWIKPEWMDPHRFAGLYSYLARPHRLADEWLGARLAPWCVHRADLQRWVLEQFDPRVEPVLVPWHHDACGCRCPQPLRPEHRALCVAGARDYSLSLNHFRPGKGPIRALKDLLECCRNEGVRAALVLTPESTEFRGWYTPDCKAAVDELLAEMRRDYGAAVIDATCWLDDDDFFDGHHPDDSGAAKFTGRLIPEVERLLR